MLRLAALFALLASPASAQDLGQLAQGGLTGQSLGLIGLVTVLSLAPGLAIMITCFPFIVTVLSILRQAIGVPQAPPNMMIVSLALFLTWFIMEPVFQQAWSAGLSPLIDGKLPPLEGLTAALAPFRGFMAARIEPATFATLAELRATDGATPLLSPDAPLSLLAPSFMLSEITRAFQIGFMVFLPFLVIDLVVSAVLMSMGMMMVPPAMVALPFKLAFFVVTDGWTLMSAALVRSYS